MAPELTVKKASGGDVGGGGRVERLRGQELK